MTVPPPALFYPIVPDIAWLKRLVPLGIKTVQLRIKDTPQDSVRVQVTEAIAVCRAHGCDLIINDDWHAAIDAGATLVHLGQEDLAAADLPAIRRDGIGIGISTHSEDELETALAAGPYYIALGPIYETKLKAMQWAPQGLDKIAAWKSRIATLPLVAIGGMTPERAPGVIAAGADSVAVITDFITSPHPEARVSLWLDWARKMAEPKHQSSK